MAFQRFCLGTAAGFVLAMLAATVFSPFSSQVHLALAVVAGLLGGAVAIRVYNVETERLGYEWQFDDAIVKVDESKLTNMSLQDLNPFRYQLLTGETEILAGTRYSRVVLCLIPVLAALSIYMFSVAVQVGTGPSPALNKVVSTLDDINIPFVDPMSGAQLPNKETHKRKEAASGPSDGKPAKSYPLWIGPGLLSVLFAFAAWWVWIDWRSSAALITNLRLARNRVPPVYFQFMKVEDDPTLLSRIQDVDTVDTLLGRVFMRSWGSVVFRINWGDNKLDIQRLDRIPGHEAYARTLREAALAAGGGTSFKQDLQSSSRL